MSEAAGNINIVLSVNKANYSAAMAEAQRQLDVFAGKAKGAGHSTVSSMQASSAAIREMNGDFTRNTRAVERFITTIPGVGKALQMAFPLVGGVAFAAMIVSAGMKVAEFIEKVNKMPKALSDGFASMHLAAMSTSDALHLANDELQNSINKLQGKPQNNLAIQLDEARINADALATSLENDAKKFKDLLTSNQISALGGLLTGKAGTAGVTGAAESFFGDIQHLGAVYAQTVHDHPAQNGAMSPEAKKALDDLKAKQDAALAWSRRELFIRDNPQYQDPNDEDMAGNQSGNRAILLGFQDMVGEQQSRQADESTHGSLTAQNKKLEADKAAAAQAKEAQEKAAKDLMQVWTDHLNEMKQVGQVSTLQERTYWSGLIILAQKYPQALKEVNAHIAEANQQLYRELEERWSKEREAATKSAEEIKKQDDLMQRLADEMDRQDHRKADYETALTVATQESTSAIADQATAHDLATGAITRHAAALQAAAQHAATYKAQIAALQVGGPEWMADNNDASMTPEQRAANQEQRNVKIVSLQGQADRTAQTDSWAAGSSTAGGGFNSAIQEFIAASKDAAAQMRDLVSNTLHGLNDQLVAGMMGKRTDFKGFGSGVFKSVATTSLQKGEGALMGAMGLGKLGTKSNPMHVIMDAAGAAGKAVGTVAGAVSGAASGTIGKIGGIFGSMLKTILPGFADGGYMNGPAIVGENGPELLSATGYVTPNHKLNFGGGGDIHFHPGAIDARGSNDPAQVEAAVQRGIRAAAPHIMAGSVKANREQMKRRPSRG